MHTICLVMFTISHLSNISQIYPIPFIHLSISLPLVYLNFSHNLLNVTDAAFIPVDVESPTSSWSINENTTILKKVDSVFSISYQLSIDHQILTIEMLIVLS